jgi:hypothetical protein
MLVLNRSAKSIAFSLVCLFSMGVQAAPLTLVGPTTSVNAVQQTNNNPCIFGDPSCSPGGLGAYTVLPANPAGNVYVATQSYALTTVRSAVGNLWNIGIDVNTNNVASETLNLFSIELDGALLYSYTGGANIAATINSNGNGYTDWFLTAIDLTGLTGTTLTFNLNMSGAVSGREQFFIVDVPERTPVPVPASLMLVGLGLLALRSVRKNA